MNEEVKQLTSHLIEIKKQVLKVADDLEKTVCLSKENEKRIEEIQSQNHVKEILIKRLVDNIVWIAIAIGIMINLVLKVWS